MRKTLSAILAVLLAASLCACGNNATESTSSPEPTATAEATVTPKPTVKPTNNTSSSESSYNQIESCIECGKPATRTYTNPFSGKIEHYCETDYQRIIDIMSEMESDVGKSEQSGTLAWNAVKKEHINILVLPDEQNITVRSIMKSFKKCSNLSG